MARKCPNKFPARELSWLSEIKNRGPELTQLSPIGFRTVEATNPGSSTVPESHPFYEFNIQKDGRGTLFVGKQRFQRKAPDFLLLSPGRPHWFKASQYPFHFSTIYFLPSVVMEMGPSVDGVRILRRFSGTDESPSPLMRAPHALTEKLMEGFAQFEKEFAQTGFGREIRLKTLLLEMLVNLLRFDGVYGTDSNNNTSMRAWAALDRSLQFLHTHYTEPIYAEDLALEAGVSKSQLKLLFHDFLGMPWSRYLQAYRIQKAATLLSDGRLNVTQAALSVGFDHLGHFTNTFHSIMGMTPRAFTRRST